MKRIILCLSLFAFFGSQAQQINPVPDYVFSNKMSVGRNAVTDTAAYFSIGPRYGAIRGFMPPMVTDTATITTGKRNGLTIFSIQKNKYMFWDSVRVQWSDFAGSSGAYIFATDTSSMLSPYIRHAGNGLTKTGQALSVDTAAIATRARVQKGIDSLGAVKGSGTVTSVSAGTGMSFTTITTTGSVAVDTLTLSTRAWRQKGDDSLGAVIATKVNISDTATMLNTYTLGSGTLNYVPKFTTARTLGNSQIFDNGTNVGIGTSTVSSKLTIATADATSTTRNAITITDQTNTSAVLQIGNSIVNILPGGSAALALGSNNTERMRIFANGRVGINTTTDAGYQLDVAGSIRNTTGANFATSGGDVGIGTATPANYSGINSLTINGTNGGLIDFQNGGSRVGTIFATTTQARFGGVQKIPVELISNNAVGFLMDTARNIGINLTSGISERLDVNGRIRARTIDSTSSPINVLTSDVNGVIRKTAVPSGGVGGSGTTNYLAKFTASGTVGNSVAFDNDGTELLVNTTTDIGAYALQVAGNAYLGSGKLDIASNTTYGLGVSRTGTSAVAGQIYNSNGILYLGVESSTGGGIFTGSSAYAAVIGSGANYSLQFATNNITRATIDNAGAFLINATSAYNVANKMEVYGPMMVRNSPTSGSLNLDSTQLTINNVTNRTPIQVSAFNLTGSGGNSMVSIAGTWNTTANTTAFDISLTNTASGASSNYMRITDGTNEFKVTKAAEVVTAAPTGGSVRKWKLGEAATVSPTSPNRTIRVEIDGTVYYLHAKTTND